MPEESLMGGADTHIPALDDDAGQPDVNENDGVQDDVTPDADQQDDSDGGDISGGVDDTDGDDAADDSDGGDVDASDDEGLLAQFAKRTGLDPKDPNQLKTLKTLVDKEKYIRELKAKLDGPADASQGLTKFEREQNAAQQKATAEAQPGADSTPRPPVIGQYNDIGAKWQSPTDAYSALSQAWSEAAETGNYQNVIATEAAMFERRFDAIGVPKLNQFMEARLSSFLQENFGAILPSLQEQAAERSASEHAEFALAELESTGDYKDIRNLDQEQEGPPLVVNGEKYRNTPLNRILTENPWILNIKREHADPKVADRLTYLARLKAAHKIHSSGQISSQKAKALVDAGSKVEQRKTQDRVRQSLNRGGSTGRPLNQGDPKPKGYVEDLLGSTDGPVSFADL